MIDITYVPMLDGGVALTIAGIVVAFAGVIIGPLVTRLFQLRDLPPGSARQERVIETAAALILCVFVIIVILGSLLYMATTTVMRPIFVAP